MVKMPQNFNKNGFIFSLQKKNSQNTANFVETQTKYKTCTIILMFYGDE